MKTLKQILHELIQIRKLLQSIESRQEQSTKHFELTVGKKTWLGERN